MAERLGQSLVNIKDGIISLGENIGAWFASLGEKIVNLGDTIIQGIKDLLTSLFSVDMDKISANITLVDKWKEKFAIFYDMQDKFEELYNGVSTNATLMSDGGVALMSSDDGYVNLADPLKIYMEVPECLSELGLDTICVLDLNQPEFLKAFAWCRLFLKWSIWFGFFFHCVRIVTPRFTIS